MALSPTIPLIVRGIFASSRNYCVLSNQCLGLGCLRQQNDLPFKIQRAQKYTKGEYSDKNQPKLGSIHYFRYQIRHGKGSEGEAKSRSWEYKLTKYLFSLPGVLVIIVFFGIYQKKMSQNEETHWFTKLVVDKFKRIKKFLLE